MPFLHDGCNRLLYLIYLGLPLNKKQYSVFNHDLLIDSPLFVTKFEIRDIYSDLVSKATHVSINDSA